MLSICIKEVSQARSEKPENIEYYMIHCPSKTGPGHSYMNEKFTSSFIASMYSLICLSELFYLFVTEFKQIQLVSQLNS